MLDENTFIIHHVRKCIVGYKGFEEVKKLLRKLYS